ncbi:MAG: DUF2201 family putative metallopeptidase, partial [Caulobacterales bacterium]
MAISSPAEEASRITRARIRLALRQPFLAAALMRLPLIAGHPSWCATMATDGYYIYYNRDWMAGLDDGELRGVIAHELMHVVFAHGARRGDRDFAVWNQACDHAINLLLLEQGFALPAGGMFDRTFIGMSAEQIYEHLLSRSEDDTSGSAQLSMQVGPGGRGGSVEEDSGILVSPGADLLDPDDPRLSSVRPKGGPDREQVREIILDLREACLTGLHGNAGAWFAEECAKADAASIDWRALLRTWLSDRLRGDWSLWPANKKHVHRGLILPSMSAPAPGHIVFAVDTSGSMSHRDLAPIYAEIAAFRETFPCRLTVVQADAGIKQIERYEAEDGAEIPSTFSVVG